jgi:hypothetical protein
MVKTQYIDVKLLEDAIEKSGLRIQHIIDNLGISRQAFDKKRKGQVAFRQSEVYVMCDLLKITDDNMKMRIFFPGSVRS